MATGSLFEQGGTTRLKLLLLSVEGMPSIGQDGHHAWQPVLRDALALWPSTLFQHFGPSHGLRVLACLGDLRHNGHIVIALGNTQMRYAAGAMFLVSVDFTGNALQFDLAEDAFGAGAAWTASAIIREDLTSNGIQPKFGASAAALGCALTSQGANSVPCTGTSVAVGAPGMQAGGTSQGGVFVLYFNKQGRLFDRLLIAGAASIGESVSDLGSALTAVGDIDDNEVPDFAATCLSPSGEWQIAIFELDGGTSAHPIQTGKRVLGSVLRATIVSARRIPHLQAVNDRLFLAGAQSLQGGIAAASIKQPGQRHALSLILGLRSSLNASATVLQLHFTRRAQLRTVQQLATADNTSVPHLGHFIVVLGQPSFYTSAATMWMSVRASSPFPGGHAGLAVLTHAAQSFDNPRRAPAAPMTCPPSLQVLPSAGKSTALAAACPHLQLVRGRVPAIARDSGHVKLVPSLDGNKLIGAAAYPMLDDGHPNAASAVSPSVSLFLAVTVLAHAEVLLVKAPNAPFEPPSEETQALRLPLLQAGMFDPMIHTAASIGPILPFTLGDLNGDGSIDIGV